MSYRHSSYRKVKRAVQAARELPPNGDMTGYARHHGNRISHWLNARPLDKPLAWGKPRDWRL
ncbi:hypothetical protein [Streptomyces sp. NPDC058664]|uniref:hypothetical protein n=1 Tax=unclassified Streptomyces TaxID=2593676 RepID=UPI003658F0CE